MPVNKDKKSGKWEARVWWIGPDGKRNSAFKRGFKTKAAAARWEEDQLQENQGAVHVTPMKSVTLNQVYNEYIERLKALHRAPNTIRFYEESSGSYLPQLGSMRIQDITPMRVQAWVNGLMNDHDYRHQTVRTYFRSLRAVTNYAVKLGLIDKAPCTGIELPTPQPHEATIYTGDDIRGALGCLREEEHPLYWPVAFCAFTGMRRGEALGVRWQDIDFEDGSVRIRGNLTGDGKTAGYKCPKNESSASSVALPASFVDELRQLKKDRFAAGMCKTGEQAFPEFTPCADLDPAQFVCIDASGSVFRPNSMAPMLRRYQKAHGLLESTWHDLRHTFGTLLAESGVDVATISKAMRHSSIHVTSDMYIKPTMEMKRHAVDVMTKIIEKSK